MGDVVIGGKLGRWGSVPERKLETKCLVATVVGEVREKQKLK